jgi:hypothetical protein
VGKSKMDARKPHYVEIRLPAQGDTAASHLKLTLWAYSRAVILNMFRQYDVSVWRIDD